MNFEGLSGASSSVKEGTQRENIKGKKRIMAKTILYDNSLQETSHPESYR